MDAPKQFDKVKLITDRVLSKMVGKGDEGYIIEVFPDGKFEVEFSDPATGETLALVVVSRDDVQLQAD